MESVLSIVCLSFSSPHFPHWTVFACLLYRYFTNSFHFLISLTVCILLTFACSFSVVFVIFQLNLFCLRHFVTDPLFHRAFFNNILELERYLAEKG